MMYMYALRGRGNYDLVYRTACNNTIVEIFTGSTTEELNSNGSSTWLVSGKAGHFTIYTKLVEAEVGL
jgi:hypothetical protein